MIEETGTVVGIDDRGVQVRIETAGTCDECTLRESCRSAGEVVTVPGAAEVGVGDRVRVLVRSVSILKVSAIVYGIPLAALFAGVLGGYLVAFRGLSEDPRILLSALAGGALLGAGALIVSGIDRRLGPKVKREIETL